MEVGYLIYSYRKGRAYIEDLVISDSSHFISIMRSIENIFKPLSIVALIEPHLMWFFSPTRKRIFKYSGYNFT